MQTRTLGPTAVEVSAIGFGAMHLSLEGRPPEDDAMDVVHHVLDQGVTFIDTADSYCTDESDKHHNERLVRKALDAYGGDTSHVVVATKGGLMRPNGRWTRNGDPDHIRTTIRESADALGGAPIDLWQHHAPDASVPVETSLQPVHDAVNEGLIRYVGVSNYSVEQIERAQEVVDVVSVQNQYSPWHRRPEQDGVLDYCEAHDLVFLPWSPLGGRSRAKDLDAFDGLKALADAKGISPQRLILAWLMAQSPAVLPIPGASRVATAEDSIAAVDVVLTDDEVRQTEAAMAAT
jgi:pyridoxine 4-dehydrogenase